MSLAEMSEFLSKLRDRQEMPIDENEYHLLGEIAERLREIYDQVSGEGLWKY